MPQPHRPIRYWKPLRRTRPCAAADCTQREQIRTDAILTNGSVPLSLCTRHWTEYRDRLPAFDQDRLLPTPRLEAEGRPMR